MKLKIKTPEYDIEKYSIHYLKNSPSNVKILLKDDIKVLVNVSQNVSSGEKIGESNGYFIHCSINGKIIKIEKEFIEIENNNQKNDNNNQSYEKSSEKDYISFLKEVGIIGMGGGNCPAYIKSKNCKSVHTLIINAVECEPYVYIDQILLYKESKYIKKAALVAAKAAGAKNIIIAIKKRNKTELDLLKELYKDFNIILMDKLYPAGAARIILKKLTGRIFPKNVHLVDCGYLFHNTATLWATGKAILDNIPSIERPLTLYNFENNMIKNLIVPIGTSVSELLKLSDIKIKATDTLFASGLMMGERINIDYSIKKSTNSIFIVPIERTETKKEIDCLNCGKCIDVCPLGLHPSTLMKKIKNNCVNKLTKAQLDECFLCGSCSYVCPSRIDILKYLKEGKNVR